MANLELEDDGVFLFPLKISSAGIEWGMLLEGLYGWKIEKLCEKCDTLLGFQDAIHKKLKKASKEILKNREYEFCLQPGHFIKFRTIEQAGQDILVGISFLNENDRKFFSWKYLHCSDVKLMPVKRATVDYCLRWRRANDLVIDDLVYRLEELFDVISKVPGAIPIFQEDVFYQKLVEVWRVHGPEGRVDLAHFKGITIKGGFTGGHLGDITDPEEIKKTIKNPQGKELCIDRGQDYYFPETVKAYFQFVLEAGPEYFEGKHHLDEKLVLLAKYFQAYLDIAYSLK